MSARAAGSPASSALRRPCKDYGGVVAPAKYAEARSLPKETLDLWLEQVAAAAQGSTIRTLLDLGCGTGRFSTPLAKRFRASVLGVDPSAAMLAQARKSAAGAVRFRRGSAERIPMADGRADMMFMSQVWHHLGNPAQAAREIMRVLAPGGLACIRNSTAENIGSYLYMRFFPGARKACRSLLPSSTDVITTMERGRFCLVRHRVVRQVFAPNLRAYLGKIRKRTLFDLARLSDEEFAVGLSRLARYCRSHTPGRAVTEKMGFFVFRSPLRD